MTNIPSGKAAALSGLTLEQNNISTRSHNIANAETKGHKQQYITNTELTYGGVKGQDHRMIESHGPLEQNGIETSLAVDGGRGMLPVKNKQGEIFYAPTGNFPVNKDSIMEMENGGYYLQGWRYNQDNDVFIKTLESVTIPIDLKAHATAAVKMDLKLSNDGIADSGGGTAIITAGTSSAEEIMLLDDIYVDSSFEVRKTRSDNGRLITDVDKYTYGGICKTTQDGAATTIADATPSGYFSILVDGIQFASVKATEVVSPGKTNLEILTSLRDRFRSVGLRSDVKVDPAGNATLMVVPKSANSSISFQSSSGTLLDTLNLKPSNTLAFKDAKDRRFASIAELAELLETNGEDVWLDPQNKPSFILSAQQYLSTELYNGSDHNLLNVLGVVDKSKRSCLIESDYDPYKASKAMANNPDRIADLSTNFIIYDSLGIAHTIYADFIRLNGYEWAMEVYSGNPTDIDGESRNGLLQVSKLVFDAQGNLAQVSRMGISSYSDPTKVSNPFIDVGAVGDTFVINGITFTQGTDFTSIADLVGKINDQFSDIQACVVNEGTSYFLRVSPTSPEVQIDISGTTATALGMTPSAQVILPDLDDKMQINWKGVGGANPAPSSIEFQYDMENINSVSAMMRGRMEADGYRSGTLKDLEIDDGIIRGIYDNSQRIQLYKIPLAVCNNINGMKLADDGLYKETTASGKVNLIESNTGGAGSILSNMIEGSNVDIQQQITAIIGDAQRYSANGTALQTNIKIFDVIINLANKVS